MIGKPSAESEAETRRKRIDPRLIAQGWTIVDFAPGAPAAGYHAHAVREYPTASGPADYALFVGGRLVGFVEAKKVSVGIESVLSQAERYARDVVGTAFNFSGYRVPFIYSTNGEETWFGDVRSSRYRARKVSNFHTPRAVAEMLAFDLDAACAALAALPNDHTLLRDYQREAATAVEQAIAARKRQMLLAMATGTGKTFTTVNLVHRLMKAGVARRILFLVDRRALAAQAVRAFAAFAPESSLKFDKVYEVYSQHFRKADLDDDDDKKKKIDLKTIPRAYLEDPDPAKPFVYVCTIQRMAINLFGKDAVLGGGDADRDEPDDDAEKVSMPIHAFDLIIADECHRGYTTAEISTWRSTLDHFDAVKVGLTATPVQHTAAYFNHIVFRYGYEQAVREGFLVDYDIVPVKSGVRLQGVKLQTGEQIELFDADSGLTQLDVLEDERDFSVEDVERKITVPDSNRKIVEEVKRYALEHEARYGRFPKTLIFAVNDIDKRSHAQMLVDMCRDAFGRGDGFVQKITGNRNVDRPLQRIREFRNRKEPGIAVTVDMLSTGVDIPDLEFIVFLRPVKSRILFMQMLGRGTRKGEKFPDKSHFTVFDCFDGTLLKNFKGATDATQDMPLEPSRSIVEIIDAIWQNKDRDTNVRGLAKRLQRIDKAMAGETRDLFAAFVPKGDLAGFAKELPKRIASDFTATMKLLRNGSFQKLLVDYPRPRQPFVVAPGVVDTVSSHLVVRGADGNEYKPEDYLEAFARYVRDNPDRIDAIRILLDRPRGWSTEALGELKRALTADEHRFTVDTLQRVHAVRYQKHLVDLISMVKHAARAEEPLLTAAERAERAVARIRAGAALTPDQDRWLDRIRSHLAENLSIDRQDFDDMPIFVREGGWKPANDAFGGTLEGLLERINEAVAA
jgi:type I restriction enzyme, R subunit